MPAYTGIVYRDYYQGENKMSYQHATKTKAEAKRFIAANKKRVGHSKYTYHIRKARNNPRYGYYIYIYT